MILKHTINITINVDKLKYPCKEYAEELLIRMVASAGKYTDDKWTVEQHGDATAYEVGV